MIKLHYHPMSTFARRVHMALIEKGIPFELVLVDMVARAHRQEPYLALNPYGRVPTLEEEGFVLYESTAILTYLEETHPSPPLVPPDARGRARMAMHMKLCDLEMARPTGTIIFPRRFMKRERWDLAAQAAAQAEIGAHLAILDKALSTGPYLLGERFSLADIVYAPFLQFLPLMEITPPPGIAAWRERLLSRPSALATRPPDADKV